MSTRTTKTDTIQKEMEELAKKVATHTAAEVVRQLNLDNRTGETPGISEGDNDMPKRFKEKIIINGKARWITGFTMQQLFDNYVSSCKRWNFISG